MLKIHNDFETCPRSPGRVGVVGRFKWPEMEGAWLLISPRLRDPKDWNGATSQGQLDAPEVSFFYDAGEWAAEWEPRYGPIQLHHRVTEGGSPHYFYDRHDSDPLGWSQMAVENYGLPEMFCAGDYQGIFNVLREFCENR